MNRRAYALTIIPNVVALALSLAGGCRNTPGPAFTQLAEARGLTDDLRVQLAKTSDASDRAVMADTDEESVAFARQADQAAATIENKAAALSARLQTLGYSAELRVFEDFTARFADYRK